MSTALDRGLKRICASCATRFYDMNKSPIICPKCGDEFTGAVRIKTRRTRVKPDESKAGPKTAATNEAALEEDEDDTTVSLDDLEREENGEDEDDVELEGDLDLDELANIDDEEDEEDFDDDDLSFDKVSTE